MRVDKISAMYLFDDGWNARDTIFANQKRLGVIPSNAELTPVRRAQDLGHWLGGRRSSSSGRADVYAAYLAYADAETGRRSRR